jgi:integrase-like protein
VVSRPGDPRAGRIPFRRYVTEQWFPNHVLEPTTRESYHYCLKKHILPWFGSMKMCDILPTHVREWVRYLSVHGVSPAHVRHLKVILSAIFTTALNDFVIALHPCRGVQRSSPQHRRGAPRDHHARVRPLPGDRQVRALGRGVAFGRHLGRPGARLR